MSDGEQRDVPARQRALSAAVEKAIEKAESTGAWRRRFSSTDLGDDLPDRTARRAMKDAEALGWVEKKRQQWVPGPTADEYADEPEPEPSGQIGRANPDDRWHLLTGGSETMCGTDLDFYARDSDAERKQFNRLNDPEIEAADLCLDCLGI